MADACPVSPSPAEPRDQPAGTPAPRWSRTERIDTSVFRPPERSAARRGPGGTEAIDTSLFRAMLDSAGGGEHDEGIREARRSADWYPAYVPERDNSASPEDGQPGREAPWARGRLARSDAEALVACGPEARAPSGGAARAVASQQPRPRNRAIIAVVLVIAVAGIVLTAILCGGIPRLARSFCA